MFIVACVALAFVGYLLGRVAHYWLNPTVGNPAWAPDHWIYGLILMIGGLYWGGELGWYVAAFGLGFLISDLKDLLNGKWIGPDDMSKPLKFWHID